MTTFRIQFWRVFTVQHIHQRISFETRKQIMKLNGPEILCHPVLWQWALYCMLQPECSLDASVKVAQKPQNDRWQHNIRIYIYWIILFRICMLEVCIRNGVLISHFPIEIQRDWTLCSSDSTGVGSVVFVLYTSGEKADLEGLGDGNSPVGVQGPRSWKISIKFNENFYISWN